MKPPEKLTSAADPFSEQAKKINEIIDAIAPILNARGFQNLEIEKSGGNWVFSYNPVATLAPHPFQGYKGSGVLRIRNGDANSIVPPEVQGGSSPYDYDLDDYVYYIDATYDVSGFTGNVAIGRDSSVPSDTATHAYRRIFEVLDGKILPSVQNSLEVFRCGDSAYSWGSV